MLWSIQHTIIQSLHTFLFYLVIILNESCFRLPNFSFSKPKQFSILTRYFEKYLLNSSLSSFVSSVLFCLNGVNKNDFNGYALSPAIHWEPDKKRSGCLARGQFENILASWTLPLYPIESCLMRSLWSQTACSLIEY